MRTWEMTVCRNCGHSDENHMAGFYRRCAIEVCPCGDCECEFCCE